MVQRWVALSMVLLTAISITVPGGMSIKMDLGSKEGKRDYHRKVVSTAKPTVGHNPGTTGFER